MRASSIAVPIVELQLVETVFFEHEAPEVETVIRHCPRVFRQIGLHERQPRRSHLPIVQAEIQVAVTDYRGAVFVDVGGIEFAEAEGHVKP